MSSYPLIRQLREMATTALAGVRSAPFARPVAWDPDRFAYRSSSAFRGFPLGSIGSGSLGIDTAGGFVELRTNNNWMRPIRDVPGALWALSCNDGTERTTRVLRRRGDREYENILPAAEVELSGRMPCFEMQAIDRWPIDVTVRGFSPIVPQSPQDSTIPGAVFEIDLSAPRAHREIEVSFLFGWENVLGCGGTGQTGVRTWRDHLVGLNGRLVYDDVTGNDQEPVELEGLRGFACTTRQDPPAYSHRRSTLGRHLLLGEHSDHVDITRVVRWDANQARPPLLDALGEGRTVGESELPVESAARPAGAVCATTRLAPGTSRTLRFILVWWTPEHTTEKDVVQRAKSGDHCGVRVGHYYENHFASAEEVGQYLSSQRERLHADTTELHRLLDGSTLPAWAVHALINCTDSIVCNSVLPRNGTLHTIEGMDWRWPFGGLCGTNDQRLSSQPYMSNFFTELDKSEVDSFRRLSEEGSVPHGIGNCDLSLEDADVPYGWPLRIAGALPEAEWPDLTLSQILQTYRLYCITGDETWMDRAWPDLMNNLQAVRRSLRHGIPEGGSTFDTFSFPGTFAYSATLYLAALEALLALAPRREPERVPELRALRRAARERVEAVLWDAARGYYRSTEHKDTVFFGSLAGDWFARFAGLGPVLPIARTRSHLRHQHRLLVNAVPPDDDRSAFPHCEAHFDGALVTTRMMGLFEIPSYIWQVVSYHALEAIHVGLVDEGLMAIRRIYERTWQRGWAWSADLFGNAGPVYMTHPVLWALPQALTGAALDVPRRTLELSPRKLPGDHLQRIPVCFPQWWGMLQVRWDRGAAELEIHKDFGESSPIERLVLRDADDLPHEHRLDPVWRPRKGDVQRFTLPSIR